MKFKDRPRVEPEPEPVERDDVHVAANRCPFCHEDVEAQESVVCQGCLTRHHEACWEESGVCSSCGGAQRLTSATPRPTDSKQPLQRNCLIKGCKEVSLPTERGCLEHAIRHRRLEAALSVGVGVLLTPLIGYVLHLVGNFESQTALVAWCLLLLMFLLSPLTFVRAVIAVRQARSLERTRAKERA